MTAPIQSEKSLFIRNKKILALCAVILIVAVLGMTVAVKVNQGKTLLRELFKLNKDLQEQNYYMADFEFKLLGIAYYLNKGEYSKSYTMLNQLHKQLKTKENLVKMPTFSSTEDELAFYLNLQNPRTGAFMDDAYPLCTYHGPTENVLAHIEKLSKRLGKPLKLKYPLTYLDRINTPEKLTIFLDDISTIGPIASKLPQTTFHNARDILSLARDEVNYNADEVDMIIQKNNLYTFSDEWRQTLLQWFYNAQDPETGLWGPKSKTGELVKRDLNNTSSILKAFVDESGNDIHEAFPLRYRDKLFTSTLESMAGPVPNDDELENLHEWNLKTQKSLRLLTRYIWKDASQEDKETARKLMEKYIKIKFEKYYSPEEGSFSYYPGGEHASIDGAGVFFVFKEFGAFSSSKQKRLWGPPAKNIGKPSNIRMSEFTSGNLALITQSHNINSFRIYTDVPDYNDLTSGVAAIVYPRKTPVLDIIELTVKMKRWINTTPLTMGNWVSKAAIRQRLESLHFDEVPVYESNIPNDTATTILHKNKKLVMIGFDVLQIPRHKIIFHL